MGNEKIKKENKDNWKNIFNSKKNLSDNEAEDIIDLTNKSRKKKGFRE